MKTIAIYGGRFQPFHKGHYQVYNWLISRFKDVYVVTTNKTDIKSPFNFNERRDLIRFMGVPASKIVKVTQPYFPRELLQKLDPKNTIIVAAVSEKDMSSDEARFDFSNEYIKPYPSNPKNLKPFGSVEKPHIYIITVPTFPFSVGGHPMTGATEFRKRFSSSSYNEQKTLVRDLFDKYDVNIHKLLNDKIKMKSFKTIKKELKEELTHKDFGPMLDSFVSFAADHLGIKSFPVIKYKEADGTPSFAGYTPIKGEIYIQTKNRHPMDIFRSVAHELVHHYQNENNRINDVKKEGETGSEIENEANSIAGIIMRNFGKQNPGCFSLSPLNEGIYDIGKGTAVILGGGPGSGKNWIMSRILHGHGLTEINSDIAFSHLMDKNNISKKYDEKNIDQWNINRGLAKNITAKKQRLAITNKQGLIVNGTADDPEKIAALKKNLEGAGYKTMMVHVHTSNDVSRQRNIDRHKITGDREVPENIRQEKWKKSNDSVPHYQNMFGHDYLHIDNTQDYNTLNKQQKQNVDNLHRALFKRIRRFTSTPPKTQQYDNWYNNELAKKVIKEEKIKLIPKKKYITPGDEFNTGPSTGTGGMSSTSYSVPVTETIQIICLNKYNELRESPDAGILDNVGIYSGRHTETEEKYDGNLNNREKQRKKNVYRIKKR